MGGRGPLVQLRDRAAAGDEAAADALVVQIRPAVIGWLSGSLRQRPEAEAALEDLVQEVMLRVVRGLGRCEAADDGQLVAWVAAITRNVRREWLRTELPRIMMTCALDDAVHLVHEPPSQGDLPAAARLVSSLFAALPEREQAMLVARLAGASWRELAQEWGISRTGARKRVAGVLGRLRSAFLDEIVRGRPTR